MLFSHQLGQAGLMQSAYQAAKAETGLLAGKTPPCATIVLSNATTGLPSAKAAATSGRITSSRAGCILQGMAKDGPGRENEWEKIEQEEVQNAKRGQGEGRHEHREGAEEKRCKAEHT